MSGNQKGAKLLLKNKAGENGYSPASVPHRGSEPSALKLQELCAPCNGPRDARECVSFRHGSARCERERLRRAAGRQAKEMA
jgi:hypothetical protein